MKFNPAALLGHFRATGAVRYEYSPELAGPLTDAQRATLMSITEECPVRMTLQRPVEFQLV